MMREKRERVCKEPSLEWRLWGKLYETHLAHRGARADGSYKPVHHSMEHNGNLEANSTVCCCLRYAHAESRSVTLVQRAAARARRTAASRGAPPAAPAAHGCMCASLTRSRQLPVARQQTGCADSPPTRQAQVRIGSMAASPLTAS